MCKRLYYEIWADRKHHSNKSRLKTFLLLLIVGGCTIIGFTGRLAVYFLSEIKAIVKLIKGLLVKSSASLVFGLENKIFSLF